MIHGEAQYGEDIHGEDQYGEDTYANKVRKVTKKLSTDLGETLQCLATNAPHKCVTWRLFKSVHPSDKRYTLDTLAELLSELRKGQIMTGVMHYTKGSLDEAYCDPNIADKLKMASAINLRDFIYACCHDKCFLDNWLDEITSVIFAPHNQPEPATLAPLVRVLYQINDAINSHPTQNQETH